MSADRTARADRTVCADRTAPGNGAAASFDHRDAGTAEADWVESGLLDDVRPLRLDGLRQLVVIAAHPDDESLGAGGLIAEAAGRGIPVTVIVATAGEGSHPESRTMTPQQLSARRRAEVQAAVSELAPSAVLRQLDIPDGRVAASINLLMAEIRWLVGESAAGTWLVAPWRGDRHPDHAAASEAAREVAQSTNSRLLEFPLWAWHWARPGDGNLRAEMMSGLQLPAAALHRKELALQRHRSQVEPLSDRPGDEPVVPPGFREHFRRGVEVFVDVAVDSLDRGFFDGFYASGPDPWEFESRWYEERKRAVTLAGLPRRRFASAFEPGCSIGVLTAQLAERCDRLLASDIAAAPLLEARRRLDGRPGVTFEQLQVPRDWPVGPFDLVVLSEIGYYCGPTDLSMLIEAASTSLTRDGVLLACHWRHPVDEYPLTGDEVHDRLRRESGLVVQVEHIEEDFRLDVLVRPPAISVARREGLVT